MPRISALIQKIRAAATDELAAVDTENGGTKKLDVASIMPTGAILDYAGDTAPAGFLLCFGQTLNATTSPEYLPLYQAIGNIYGGSSLNDFKLPDLRGRVVAGQDDMGGTSANRLTMPVAGMPDGDVLGSTGGAETHTLTTAQMPAHIHYPLTEWGTNVNLNQNSGAGAGYQQVAGPNAGTKSTNNAGTSSTGGGGAHNNVQPTIILNKIIKY